jgi:hypothetical protein
VKEKRKEGRHFVLESEILIISKEVKKEDARLSLSDFSILHLKSV